MIALFVACANDPAPPGENTSLDPAGDPFLGGDCSPVPTCGDCDVAVTAIDHPAWFNRLTESPPLLVTTTGSDEGVLQTAFGRAPGTPDVWCWDDVPADAGSPFQVRSLWLTAGETVYAMARWQYPDGRASPAVDSAGWTVDIVAPEGVAAVASHRAVTEHAFAWSGGGDDDLSGFSHYEAALGSLPGASDLVPWTATDGATFEFAVEDATLGQWAYPSARTVDAAGNASLATIGEGFIRCFPGYVFVPANDAPGIETDGFCVEKYEAKILGEDNGNLGWSERFVEEARASGTPWANVERALGSIACAAHGMQYTLISNRRWQALARDLEAADENWSGGTVGVGALNRGHCDGDPHRALEASTDDDPCFGTNNPACEDPTSPDWGAKRTHSLTNGEVVWDLAGNIWEHVNGALALDAGGLWTPFDAPLFTSDAGWEDRRANFGPGGDFTTEHGVGLFYVGSTELLRGGSFASNDNPGSAGSAGEWDSGLYNGHHHVWWGADETQGFRCVYSP